jgi:hypothetical protein
MGGSPLGHGSNFDMQSQLLSSLLKRRHFSTEVELRIPRMGISVNVLATEFPDAPCELAQYFMDGRRRYWQATIQYFGDNGFLTHWPIPCKRFRH